MSQRCTFCHGKNDFCTQSKRQKQPTMLPEKCNFDINRIPESVLLHTFSFLAVRDLLSLRCVSKLWKRIAEDKQLWRSVNLSCKRIKESNLLFRLPERISQHVRVVNLMWSYMTIPSFKCIKTIFKNMEILLLQYCKFSIPVRERNVLRLTNCIDLPPNLKILDVRNVQGSWFEDTGTLVSLPKIEAMAFSQTLPSDWLSRLSTTWLPRLKVLHVQNNPALTDPFLKRIIKNTPRLESLSVRGCIYVKGNFLSTIEELSSFNTLDISGTRIAGEHITAVDWEKIKITDLNISFCCKLLEADMRYLLSKLRYLRQLRVCFVGWGRSLTDKVINHISQQSKLLLVTIDIQSTFAMSTKALAKLCRHCPNLQYLRIGTIVKNEEELLMLLNDLPKIKSLSLQLCECSFTAPALFNALSQKCLHLQSLFVYNIYYEKCLHETLKLSLVAMFTSCRSLRNVFTGGYPHKQKQLDTIIKEVAGTINIKVNSNGPARIIPQADVCFDKYLCSTLKKRGYSANFSKQTAQNGVHCHAFYKTNHKRLDDHHFSLLRT